jgi:hypothetical protein
MVSTASHGGVHLSHDRAVSLADTCPVALLLMGHSVQDDEPKLWFEEDCYAALPLLVFADDIDAAASWTTRPNVDRSWCRKTLEWLAEHDPMRLRRQHRRRDD